MAAALGGLGDSLTNLAADSGAPAKPAPGAPAAAAAGAGGAAEPQETRKTFNHPLYSDMTDEIRTETMDMVVTAIEKHQTNYEAASKNVKEVMDKKFGSSWHVVVGEGFAFEITHEMRNLLYMYFGGSIGALVWKAST